MTTLIVSIAVMFLLTIQLALIASDLNRMEQGVRVPRLLCFRLLWAGLSLVLFERTVHSVWVLGPTFIFVATMVYGAMLYATFMRGPTIPLWPPRRESL